ncbi:MAG TPA: hypothetical protein VGI39_27335 [Polyangiaceae bacterium]|jgi:hypothetical protein
MAARKRTPEETLRAIDAQAAHDEMKRVLALSPAEVEAELRAAGFDVEAMAVETTAQVERLRARRSEQAWQAAAHEKMMRARSDLARRGAGRESLPRAELLARIERARTDARLAGPAAVLFRNKTEQEATDEELADLLEELETLAERAEKKE